MQLDYVRGKFPHLLSIKFPTCNGQASGVIERILGLEIWVLGLGFFSMRDFIPIKV